MDRIRTVQYMHFFRTSSLARNISKVLGGDVFTRVLGLATAFILIRNLKVSDYASLTVFSSVLGLIPGLVGNGINLALVRFSAEYISEAKRRPLELYTISFVFQIVLYLIFGLFLFVFSESVASLFFGGRMYINSLQLGLVGGLGYLISQAGRCVYQAEEKFGLYIRILWLKQSFMLVFVSGLLFSRLLTFDLTVKAMISIELLIGLILIFHIFHDFRVNDLLVFFRSHFSVIKEFLVSTQWLIAYFIVLTLFQQMDIFMLAHFSPQEELAIYGVAFKYYSLSLLTLSSIHAVLLPRFSKIDMKDFLKQRHFVVKWLKVVSWLIIPIAAFDLFGKPLFVLVNGVQYEKSFYIFIIFSVGIWLSLMFSPLVNILMNRKAFKFLFTISVVALIFNFFGNFFFIPLWGGFGAAVVVVASYGIINISSAIRAFCSAK